MTGERVAIKVFKESGSLALHQAATEYVCATRAAGPYALEYHSLAFMNGKPAIVMELANMSLDKYIKVSSSWCWHRMHGHWTLKCTHTVARTPP